MKKSLLLFLCYFIGCSLWSYYSDQFVVGCYSNLKPNSGSTTLNNNLLTKMQAAHYNASICENTENSPNLPLMSSLLTAFHDHGIDPLLVDYHNGYNPTTGELTSAGTHTISTGNYWKFEAEFDVDDGYDGNVNSNNKYFYKFAPTGRVGSRGSDEGNNVWQCVSSSPGLALYGLKYRYHNPARSDDKIGPEFRFGLRDGTTTNQYLSWNKIYIKVRYRIDPNASNTANALAFKCNFAPDNSNAGFRNLTNTKYPTHNGAELIYTYGDLRSNVYSDPPPTGTSTNYRTITFAIDMMDLWNAGYMVDGYWFCSLKHIDPYINFYGNGWVNIDYVEIYDKMYDTLETQPQVAKQWLSDRLDDYPTNKLAYVKSFYTLDEPQQAQMATYSKLKSILQQSLSDLSVGYDIKSFSTVNWSGGKRVKPGGKKFSLPELFIDPLNQYNPEELMVDYYPIQPEYNWNNSDQNAVNNVQWALDYKTLHFYNNLRRSTRDQNIPFYVVPPSAGQWNEDHSTNDPEPDRWDYYMLATANMQKCLQLLPLCYGVDGVINWMLYGNVPHRSDDELNLDEPYETAIDRDGDRASYRYWYALIDNYSDVLYETPQYLAISAANSKLLSYGHKLKDLVWDKAAYLDASGLHLQSDIYGQESYYSANVSPGSMLNSLTAYDPNFSTNGTSYQGFVQAGLYNDLSANPYYMLVNRRTDFVSASTTPSGQMIYLTPTQMRAPYGTGGVANGFYTAPAQSVNFEVNQNSISRYGDGVSLFDPDTKAIYSRIGNNITVPIGPGDGIMLEMCGSVLPGSTISQHVTLSTKAILVGNITIASGGTLEITQNSNTEVFDNTTIIVQPGGSLIIRGQVTLGTMVNINNNGGTINFDNANCVSSFNSGIMNVNGVLNITDSSFDKKPGSSMWSGIISEDSIVFILNSTISNASNISLTNSNLSMTDCVVNVRGGGTGLLIENNETGHTTQISSNLPDKGFYGLSTVGTKGIWFSVMKNPVNISSVEFHNLSVGIRRFGDVVSGDIVYNCQFYNCNKGIYETGSNNQGVIQSSSFLDNNIGIHATVSFPMINGTEFVRCNVGVLSDFPMRAQKNIISHSYFISCEIGVEGFNSNTRIDSTRFESTFGIICHDGSNMYLADNARNAFHDYACHILFYDMLPYRAYIQLFRGHNDFYHYSEIDPTQNTVDLMFDGNYSSSTSSPIQLDKNWFEGQTVNISTPNGLQAQYVTYYLLDSFPNTPDPYIYTERYLLALDLEHQEQYEQAIATYKDILNEQLESEKIFYSGAIDGIYRVTQLIDNPDWDMVDFFNAKELQYRIDDPELSALLEKYKTKSLIINKEYQEAIDLIQLRIDNPANEADSLMAVLELEVVLQLATMEGSKKPITTSYTQYQYADVETYYTKHDEHWAKLKDLLGKADESNGPLLPTPAITSNYPNPFNPSTTVTFSIPETGRVRVFVYNIKGQKVKELIDSEMSRGYHSLLWNGKDTNNRNVSSGVYFFKLESGGKTSIRKAMLMK